MSKKLKQLGMQREFDEWINRKPGKPTKFDDIKVGQKIEIINLPSYQGCKGYISKIEGEKIWMQTWFPSGKKDSEGYITRKYWRKHLRFI